MLFSGSLTLFSTIPFDSSCSILLSDFCLEQPVSFIPQSSLRFKFFAFGLLLAHAFVASAGVAAAVASYFFSAETGARSPSPRIPQNLAEPEECGRRRANIEWSEPRLPNSFNSLQVSKCVTTTEARAAAGTHTGFRRDSTQNCFCYWCASVAVGVTLCFQCCRYMRPLKARNPAHNAVVLPHTNKDHTDLQSRHWIHSGGSLSSCEVSSFCCA